MNNDELPASVTEKAAPTPLPWQWDGDDLWHFGESYDSATDPHRYTGITINRKLRSSNILKANMQLIVSVLNATAAAPPVRTYSEADEVADSLKYIAETSHNAGVAKTFAALSGEFHKVTGKAAGTTCSKCGYGIHPDKYSMNGWSHDVTITDAQFNRVLEVGCYNRAVPAVTPDPIVISSPAHFLPELKSDADHFAEEYRLQHDLPFSMLTHLAWAWLMGKQDERLRGGK